MSKVLLHRYLVTFRHAWQHRKALDGRERLSLEAEFLPAALSLRDTPTPAAPRILMALLGAFVLIAVAWAVFGKVDIVATAHGKIVPDNFTKTVQAPEAAVIKNIHVRDGQRVHAGEALIELDSTISQADVDRLTLELAATQLQSARARLMWQAIHAGTTPHKIEAPRYANGLMVAEENRLLTGQYQEFFSKLASIEAEITRHRAELETIQQTITKFERTAPIAEQRAKAFQNLSERNFMSKHAWLEKEQASIELKQDLAAEKARVQEIRAMLGESEKRREALIAETARIALDHQREAEQNAAALSQEVIKAERKNHQH